MSRSWIFPLLALAAACSDGTSSDGHAIYSVDPASQWSGGTVTVRSPAFSGANLPAVYAEGRALFVTRVDDTTLTVRLPVTLGGDLVIARQASGHDTIGVVLVAGFDRSRSVPGTLGYEPLALEGAPTVVFVAENTGVPHGLSFLDPSTDQASYVQDLGPVSPSFGLQPSFQDNRFVLADSAGNHGVWQLFPAPAFIDTVAVHNNVARHVSQLSPNVWLETFSNILQAAGPGAQYFFQSLTNDPIRLVFSPNRSRLAMSLYSAPGLHAPVMDAATGDTAYSLPIARPWGVAFARQVDRLYVSASTLQGDSLIAVRGSDGLRLGAIALPAGYSGYTLEADAKVDRVYQVAESSGTKALLVYDGATLALIGQLVCPGTCGNSYSWSAGIGVDTVANKIHVAFPGSPIPVITYDRLP